MINFQQASAGGPAALSPTALRRLWFWSPIAAGGTLAVVLMLALGLPQILEISRLLNHLQELEQQRQELSLLKLQGVKTREDMQQVRRQGEQLVRLVAGNGSLATVLATLDLEASQAKVQLQLYEPLAAGGRANAAPGQTAAVPAPPPASPPAPAGTPGMQPGINRPAAADPMSKAGLRERSLVLEARGTYPRLLDFLRRLEALDVLVEQKDLSLSAEELQAGAPASRLPSSTPIVDLRLSLTLWSKNGTQEPSKPTAGTNPSSPIPPAPPG